MHALKSRQLLARNRHKVRITRWLEVLTSTSLSIIPISSALIRNSALEDQTLWKALNLKKAPAGQKLQRELWVLALENFGPANIRWSFRTQSTRICAACARAGRGINQERGGVFFASSSTLCARSHLPCDLLRSASSWMRPVLTLSPVGFKGAGLLKNRDTRP